MFTDVEGSTRAWEAYPAETQMALKQHDEIVAGKIEAHNGALILERGEGDSVFSVFDRANDAVAAACEIQCALRAQTWPPNVPIRVRMAIHTGEAGADYRGPHVNRAARLRAIAHGEQILISGITAGILRDALPDGASLIDLRRHRLRDLSESEHVFQLAHPKLRSDFPPLKSLSYFQQNLPIQLTSFIGRVGEQQTVRALIEKHCVVTLVGAGGCGKTRLAIQVGADVLENFPDGVRFVDLAPLGGVGLVMDAIATVIGAKIDAELNAVDALARALEGTQTLIILDNCEHVLAESAEAVSTLLRANGDVRVLATSREPLGLPGEMISRVPPLSLPDGERGPDEVISCEAVQLFVDRAIAARRGFSLTRLNMEAVVEICRTLEGLPVAIELAAARAKTLTPQDIRARLSDRFRLLTGGRGRHQTLRSTIDWSYDLLPENERALFRRLSVFAAGSDLQAVEAICGDSLDTIEHLVDKSLVIVEQLGDDRLRYRLLETLRHYAAERVAEAGEEESARERHFNYYVDLAERSYSRRIEDEAASLASLDADHDNFRSALQWARTRRRDLLRLASVLGWFWHLRSYYREGRAWLEEALAAAPNDRSPEAARALWALSMILNWSGGDVGARRLADRSLELWQENGKPLELALALESIGFSQFMAGEYADALRSMEDCLEQYRNFGSEKLVTRGRVNVGQMLVALGHVEHTEPLARETLAEGRAQKRAQIHSLLALPGRLRLMARRAEESRPHLRRQLARGA
jgi:predicted ATPase/class 3 adenylate cyclase